jgi:hypothetical protein
LAQDQPNRGKNGKAIHPRMNIFLPSRLLPAWEDIPISVGTSAIV